MKTEALIMNSYQRIAIILGILTVFSLVRLNYFVLAQDNRDILRDLQRCGVLIEDLQPQIERDGLTKRQLQADTELKFRMAGIKVLSHKEVQEKSSPFFYLRIRVLKLRSGCYSYHIAADLCEKVLSVRKSYLTWAATWSQLPETIGFTCRLSDIRQDAKDMVDGFINAYLSVNPKP